MPYTCLSAHEILLYENGLLSTGYRYFLPSIFRFSDVVFLRVKKTGRNFFTVNHRSILRDLLIAVFITLGPGFKCPKNINKVLNKRFEHYKKSIDFFVQFKET